MPTDTEDILDDDLDLDFSDDELDMGIDPFQDYGSQSNINKHSDLLKDLTNFDPVIQARIRNWLGLEYDDTTKGYIQKQEAIINIKGARWAIGFLQTYQVKTNIITNINEREFKNLHLDLIKMIWLVFPTIDDFKVESTADWYRLCTELEHSAFLVLAGAGDGKYTKFLGESVQRTENISYNNNQPNPNTYRPQSNELKGGWAGRIKNKMLGR